MFWVKVCLQHVLKITIPSQKGVKIWWICLQEVVIFEFSCRQFVDIKYTNPNGGRLSGLIGFRFDSFFVEGAKKKTVSITWRRAAWSRSHLPWLCHAGKKGYERSIIIGGELQRRLIGAATEDALVNSSGTKPNQWSRVFIEMLVLMFTHTFVIWSDRYRL